VDVTGGSKFLPPTRVVLRLADTQLEYSPKKREFAIRSYNSQIAYIPYWKTCKLEAHLYHFKHLLWKDFLILVDSFNKAVYRVTGGNFCRDDGVKVSMDVAVTTD
jgi:hypothetical protein